MQGRGGVKCKITWNVWRLYACLGSQILVNIHPRWKKHFSLRLGIAVYLQWICVALNTCLINTKPIWFELSHLYTLVHAGILIRSTPAQESDTPQPQERKRYSCIYSELVWAINGTEILRLDLLLE